MKEEMQEDSLMEETSNSSMDMDLEMQSDYDEFDQGFDYLPRCTENSLLCRCKVDGYRFDFEKFPHPNRNESLDLWNVKTRNLFFFISGSGYGAYDAYLRDNYPFGYADMFKCYQIGNSFDGSICKCSTGGDWEDMTLKSCTNSGTACAQNGCIPICVAKADYLRCFADGNGVDEMPWNE